MWEVLLIDCLLLDLLCLFVFFFFNDTATTEIYTLSLHDALPICILLLQCIPVQNKHDQNRRRKKPAGQKQSQKTTQKSSQKTTKQRQKSAPAETEKQ